MCVTTDFAVIYGLKAKEKIVSCQSSSRIYNAHITQPPQIQVHNFNGVRESPTISTTYHNEHASNIPLSKDNIVACIYKRWVRLFDLG